MENLQTAKRKMALNESKNDPPQATMSMVRKWIKDDIEKMVATLWLIKDDDEVLDIMAKRFYEKMQPESKEQVIAKAIKENNIQLKND